MEQIITTIINNDDDYYCYEDGDGESLLATEAPDPLFPSILYNCLVHFNEKSLAVLLLYKLRSIVLIRNCFVLVIKFILSEFN